MAGERCGVGSCAPSWLQRLASPKLFVLNLAIIRVLTGSGNAFLNSALTVIERQFKISGLESGALASVNDMAIICVVVLGAYFGYKVHRPRWIAVCCVISAIGNLLCAVPHYLSEPRQDAGDILSRENTNQGALLAKFVCDADIRPANNTDESCQAERDLTNSIVWVVFGQILIGVGGATMLPIAITYVEDAVGQSKVLTYLAFVYLGTTLGGVFGFLGSSYTNSLYVDFDRLKPEQIPDIPQKDARWIGAWWLGFLALSVFIFVSAIPMFFFPRIITPSKEEMKNGDAGNNDKDGRMVDYLRSTQKVGVKEMIRGLLPSLKRVVRNVTLWFMMLSTACVLSVTSASLANLTKFFVYQFNMSVSVASLVFVAALPLSVISHFVSAFVLRKLNHDLKKSAILIIGFKSVSVLTSIILLFVKCSTPTIAGYDVSYPNSGSVTDTMLPECHADCSCEDQDFFPICGENGITYTSPCFAGCTSFNVSIGSDGRKVFYNGCSCIDGASGSADMGASATPGFCEPGSKCRGSIVAVVLICLAAFTTAFVAQPITYIALRTSEDKDRAVALSFLQAVPKLLGPIPAPIYFGAVVNTACRLWERSCGERGNCWIYDIDKYRYVIFGMLGVLYALSMLFAGFALGSLPFTMKKISKQKEDVQSLTDMDGGQKK